jgi:integrase
MATVKLTDKAVAAAKAETGKPLELWDASTPGLCLRVSDTGRKVWVYRYRTEDGRQPRLTLGLHTKAFGLAEARDAANRIRIEVQDGGDPSGERKRRKAMARAQPIKTFNDLADAFLEASESGQWRPRNKKKRERTIRDERAILKRHARPVLGDLRLEEIDRATVRNLLRKMIARGIGAQTNRTHAVIRQAFAYAVGEERLALNPVAGLPPQADEAPRDRVLTDEELKALWGALEAPHGLRKPARKGSDETVAMYVGRPLAIAVELCALLLQRRNEVAGMRLDELDLDQGIWTIPAARMKGGQGHIVPLPPKAVTLIREAMTLAKQGRESTPPVVFPGARDAQKSIRPDSVTHTMRDLMAALGLRNASPHDLRRTGATNLVTERLGFAPFVVSKVLGHRSDTGGAAAVTLAHYALHDYAPEKRRALEAWEGQLLEIVGEKVRPSNVMKLAGTA